MDIDVLVAEFDALVCEARADVLVQVEVHIPVVGVLAPDPDHVLDSASLVLKQANEGSGIRKDPSSREESVQ